MTLTATARDHNYYCQHTGAAEQGGGGNRPPNKINVGQQLFEGGGQHAIDNRGKEKAAECDKKVCVIKEEAGEC